MIVDTSALVASLRGERHSQELRAALAREPSIVPAPVVVEYNLVTSLPNNDPDPDAVEMLDEITTGPGAIAAFTPEDAALSVEAHRLHGRGGGRGGRLNMLDVMVYCMAKRLGRPILCTGRDFSSTDAVLHPASRNW